MNMPEVMRHRISSWEYPVCDGREVNQLETFTKELMQKYNKQTESIKPLIESHGKLELENDELRQDCKEAEGIFKAMQYDGCICGYSIGNPMYNGHSKLCQRVTELLTRIGDKDK